MPDRKNPLFQYLRDWGERRNTPALDWIQIEVTSRCNASCAYCPRTVLRSSWLDRHMPFDTFKRLVPSFEKARMVHLQGWGEPFLNDDFFAMAALAKKAGCKVGTTTNGMLLGDEMINRIIGSGIDVIAFSLAGTDERNDSIRKGTDFRRVLESISHLQAVKKKCHVSKPLVNIAYMLLRSNLQDVVETIRLLQGLGIHQLIISTLDFLPTQELRHEQLMPRNDEEYMQLKSTLDGYVSEGQRAGVPVYCHVPTPGRRTPVDTCTENIQRALFISADGMVSPCVFTNLAASDGEYVLSGQAYPYKRLTFGNIRESSLVALWQGERYAAFRNSFIKGDYEPFCETCAKLH